ncbi:hypothetical protein HYPBUDRAFT_153998 [Hyphopichia burtonii NRRL Y-1933]|uniref:Uncharacterized protein n=1 Tax=Hyphopichia burtonii NRRL Y-1933 TaxID=984485 RepID=A0A1E4RCX3_9ASCO|nr:hypothetical protein HYPBUDRAFT_153998 [Hyphopichia burtonii NRRL Y-1933]ODV65119.1 hypothetical protein HYPBUDRAFT_153998 [Hyphopichia burtonii NRRL Y-1933]
MRFRSWELHRPGRSTIFRPGEYDHSAWDIPVTRAALIRETTRLAIFRPLDLIRSDLRHRFRLTNTKANTILMLIQY